MKGVPLNGVTVKADVAFLNETTPANSVRLFLYRLFALGVKLSEVMGNARAQKHVVSLSLYLPLCRFSRIMPHTFVIV